MDYDYRAETEQAVIDYIRENWKDEDIKAEFSSVEEFAERLNDDCWNADSVTGNASGSYTFNTYKAEENLCHNWDLLSEACSEFGGNMGEWVEKGAEYCDVTIRCYVLYEAIGEALERLQIDDDFFDVD